MGDKRRSHKKGKRVGGLAGKVKGGRGRGN